VTTNFFCWGTYKFLTESSNWEDGRERVGEGHDVDVSALPQTAVVHKHQEVRGGIPLAGSAGDSGRGAGGAGDPGRSPVMQTTTRACPLGEHLDDHFPPSQVRPDSSQQRPPAV
jgi:hypothetical protein